MVLSLMKSVEGGVEVWRWMVGVFLLGHDESPRLTEGREEGHCGFWGVLS